MRQNQKTHLLYASITTAINSEPGRPLYPDGCYLQNGTVYYYHISCGTAVRYYNPVTDGLKYYGIFESKESGIPEPYMQARLEIRLAVIAYDRYHNQYRFTQMAKEHRQIVFHLYDLALSCGIDARN
jgi:hypothetical protein